MVVIGVHPSLAPAIRHGSGHHDEEDAMHMGRGFLLGALGYLAIGISGGEAVAETPSQADIAGQLMPQAQLKTRGLPTLGAATRPQPDAAVTPVTHPGLHPGPPPQQERQTPP